MKDKIQSYFDDQKRIIMCTTAIAIIIVIIIKFHDQNHTDKLNAL